jgi:hypothetical protein
MKLEKKIVIEEGDISELHAEVTELLDFVSETATQDDPETFLHNEFPALTRLRRILDGLIAAEQSTRVLAKLDGAVKHSETTKKAKLKVVRDRSAP